MVQKNNSGRALGRAVMLAMTALCLAAVTVVVAPGATASPLPPIEPVCPHDLLGLDFCVGGPIHIPH